MHGGKRRAVEGCHMMLAHALVAVNHAAGLRMLAQPFGHAPPEAPVIQPARAIHHFAGGMHGDASGRLGAAHFTHHRDFVPQRVQLAGQFPHIALHAAHRAVAAHDLYDFHGRSRRFNNISFR